MNKEEVKNINRLKLGDKKAFGQIFKQYYNDLCNFGASIIRSDELAEEIVQDVFVKLWENRDKLEIHTSLKSYLLKSVHNHCLNRFRHEKVKLGYTKYVSDTEYLNNNTIMPDEEFDLHDRIDRIIREMPVRTFEIFSKSRYDGLKYQEIADEMDISVKTVEAHMSEAFGRFRTGLADYYPKYKKKDRVYKR